jgi:RNA polymerase sigma-70 factor, ECF subfamily
LNESEEATAVRLSQVGDKDAFQMLVEPYERMIFGIAYSMMHDRDSAADAVQDALVKAWRHLPSLRTENGFRAWLVRIVVNEVKQQSRRKQVPTISIEETPELSDGSDGMETETERNEMREAVRTAVQLLPPQQRETVVLRYFGGLTMSEIAFAMGCRKGTVKSRLSRALDRLGETLGGVVDENEKT